MIVVEDADVACENGLAQTLLTFAHGLLCLFALRDILNHRQEMGWRLIPASNDGESHLRPDRPAVFSDIPFLKDFVCDGAGQ